MTWTAVGTAPQNGGSVVLSYNLVYDSGTNGLVWTSLVGLSANYLSTSYTVSTGIVPGSSY